MRHTGAGLASNSTLLMAMYDQRLRGQTSASSAGLHCLLCHHDHGLPAPLQLPEAIVGVVVLMGISTGVKLDYIG